jgi:hypothetical protein
MLSSALPSIVTVNADMPVRSVSAINGPALRYSITWSARRRIDVYLDAERLGGLEVDGQFRISSTAGPDALAAKRNIL